MMIRFKVSTNNLTTFLCSPRNSEDESKNKLFACVICAKMCVIKFLLPKNIQPKRAIDIADRKNKLTNHLCPATTSKKNIYAQID